MPNPTYTWWNRQRSVRLVTCAAALLLVTGCRRQEAVKVYQVPKEDHTRNLLTALGPAQERGGGQAMATPKPLKWKVPEGWQEGAGSEVRLATFIATGSNGQKAEVTIVPLPGEVGTEADNVNRWRREIGLPETTESEIKSEVVPIGEHEGRFYEIHGTEKLIEEKFTASTLAAVIPEGNRTIFFKIRGESETVKENKPKFLAFLRSIDFGHNHGHSHADPHEGHGHEEEPTQTSSSPSAGQETNAPSAAPDNSSQSSTVPAGWKQATPGPMVLRRYQIGSESKRADVTVTAFPGEVGGLLANVNRWRGQLQQGPISEADLPKFTRTMELPGGRSATIVDLQPDSANAGMRMVTVVVKDGAQTSFYKIMGNPEVVRAEENNFLNFVKASVAKP